MNCITVRFMGYYLAYKIIIIFCPRILWVKLEKIIWTLYAYWCAFFRFGLKRKWINLLLGKLKIWGPSRSRIFFISFMFITLSKGILWQDIMRSNISAVFCNIWNKKPINSILQAIPIPVLFPSCLSTYLKVLSKLQIPSSINNIRSFKYYF